MPLANRKVPMNQMYGFRISKAFVSNDNWYAINEYGGKQFILWSVVMIAAGVILFFAPTSPLVKISPVIICPVITIVRTLLWARTLPEK